MLGFVVWVNTPRVTHRSELEKIYQAREAAFDENQKVYAQDTERNGYLDPTFFELWAKPSDFASGKVVEGHVTRTIHDLEGFNPIASKAPFKDQDRLIKENTQSKNPRQLFETSKRDFALLVPGLLKAFEKPVFIWPASRVDASAEMGNLLTIRMAAQLLAFQAHLDLEAGHPEQALNLLLISTNFARKLLANGAMINLMMGLSIQSTQADVLRQVLTGPNTLKPATLEEALRRLRQAELPPEAVTTALEFEALLAHNSLSWEYRGANQPPAATGSGVAIDYFLRYSGLTSRETRLWENDEFEFLEIASGRKPGDLSWISSITLLDDVLGHHSKFLTPVALPNPTRTKLHFNLVRAKMGALEIVLALRLYREQHHKWPQALGDLSAFEIPANPLGKPYLYSLANDKPQLLIPIPDADAESLGLKRLEPHEPGFEYSDENLHVFNGGGLNQ